MKQDPFDACLRRTANIHWGLAVLALITGPAIAQPTGNPKGTAAPPTEGSSAKPPATRNRAGAPETRRPAASGSATNPDAKAARRGQLRTPGTGTAGGLSGRHPGDGSSTGTTETDQAPRVRK
jgi:hypothetical protein